MKPLEELIFITHPIFEDKKYLGSIINWGEIVQPNNVVVYQTKEGEKRIPKNEFPSSMKLHTLDEFNFKDSLHYWIKDRRNNHHYDKPFIYDKDLTTGEVYTQYTWSVSVLIQPTDTEVKVKLILN